MDSWIASSYSNTPPPGTPASSGPWRPPQWQQTPLTSVTANLPNPESASGSSPTTYFFDAVLRIIHAQQLRKTSHPVQSGANVSDHAFMQPAKVTLEVGMSDAMAQYKNGQYSSSSSKSVSAYQTFLNIQQLRVPLTVQTRLKTYYNMLITDISSPDDVRSLHGLRMTITFEEVITATANTSSAGTVGAGTGTSTSTSARPDTTDDTGEGTKVPEDVPSATSTGHELTDSAKQLVLKAINDIQTNSYIQNVPQNIPGAGNFSSNNISAITGSGPY